MACRSRSRSPVEARVTHSINNINLDDETDFEFPMLTDEDIDCIVQDISDTGGASLGSIEKPSSIDAIQKHVEESLLFLDEEKSTIDKSENTNGASHSKINKVLEKPGSDDTVMKDVDDSLKNIEMDAFDKNTEPLKSFSGILKQDNKNDASLSDEQQKDKSEIENVTTENEVNSLLECVKEETTNIPERIETNDDIVSLEDNPISDSVLNATDKGSSINAPQEETSGISEQTDTVKVVVSKENPLSDCTVNEIDTNTGVNVSLNQNSEIPLLTDSKKANIVSLEHKTTSESVLNEINKDPAMDNPQEVTSDITEQIDTSKVIVPQEDNPLPYSVVHETDTVANFTLGQGSEIPLLTVCKKANIVSLEHNTTSESVINEMNKDKNMDHPQEVTSDITDQIDTNKVIVPQEHNLPSDSVVHETNTDEMANISLGKKCEIPLNTVGKKANIVSLEHNPTSDSVISEFNTDTAMDNSQEVTSDITEQINTNKVIVSQKENHPSTFAVHETDTHAVENISQGQKTEIPLLTVSKKANIVSLERNSTSDSKLNEMNKDTGMDSPKEVTSHITEQIDTSKVIVSHEDNPPSDSTVHDTNIYAVANVSLGQKSETPLLTNDKKASIVSLEDNSSSDTVLNQIITDVINDDSENKPSELSRQSEGNKVRSDLQGDNSLSLSTLNESDTDATIYDPELKLSDISKQSAAMKVGNASHEDNPSSENVLNKTGPNAEIVNVEKKTSDASIFLQEGNSRPYSLQDETDTDVTINYNSQEELGDNSKRMITNEISNISKEEESPSDSLLHKTDIDANMDDTQEGISEISQQNDEMDSTNASQENNGSSEGVLDETGADAAINDPQEETSDISEQIDSNEISNISQEFNNVLSDTDAAMNVSHEIPEQIEIKKVGSIYQYKVLNETDTDVTNNDSQEDISDISELIDSNEVDMVSQEDLPSDSVLNKTDIDERINESQEEINDVKISEKDDGALNSELDKTDAVLHERCETENKIIEASSDCQDNLKAIKIDDHDNSVIESQKERILIESNEMNNQADEPTQIIKNTATEDKKYDILPNLENKVEKAGLPENETQVKKEINETGQATQKSPVKELIWEIKSIKPEVEQQEKKELLQKDKSQEQNATENPIKKNLLVRAVLLEDVTECPPAKRPRFQPVWTTNPLNDEDKPKAEQAIRSDKTAMDVNTDNDTTEEAAPEHPYYEMSEQTKKQLLTWLLKNRLNHTKSKVMLKVAQDARWNRAVLRMAPIPKEFKMMDVFRVIRKQTEDYEKEITKNIQYIHIHEYDDNYNAAYIKWRDIDKLLVVKAYQILVRKSQTESLTVDGVAIHTFYDDRSVIDWNEKERPMLRQKDGTLVIPKSASTPAVTPVVTSTATNVATTEAKAAASTVAKPAASPRPRKPPPPPFINGEIREKDRISFGLSPEFMKYYNIKPPIAYFVFVNNLDLSHTVDRYYRIFSAAGVIQEMEIIPPSHEDEQQSMELRITYNHALEAVQAISMFHEQILYDRVIKVVMGKLSMKKKPFVIEGFRSVGPGLALNGFVMRNVRSSLELMKLKANTKVQLDTLKGQITALKQTLSSTTFKLEQAKRDEEKRKHKEEKKQVRSQNESQNKQASMDAVSAITKAIASSVQANVISMLSIQANQQGQNIKHTPSAAVNSQPSGMPQNQNTSRAPLNWTTNENANASPNTAKALPNTATALPNTATALPNIATASPNTGTAFPNTGTALPNTTTAFPNTGTALPNTATAFPNTGTALPNPNMHGQTSLENAFQNLGSQLQGYQNPQDPYGYYASMQQAYAQYYNMDPSMLQAHAYAQTGTSYMQPAFSNVQPVPAVQTSNMPPTTQSMPTTVSKSKVHTETKTVFPPLPNTNKNVTVYEKPPLRFDKPLANVGNKTTAPSRFDIPPAKVGQTTATLSKVPEIPLPIPTISQPAVKMAFKTQKPIVPTKEIKPASINIKIPSVLPETVPLVVQNPRTLEKNSVQRKLMKMAGKIPAEPWINKQIRDMRKNSKSPERIRKSPEKIKSPDRAQKNLSKTILPPKAVKRLSRSPDRRSRSPVRRNSRSPIRRRSRSTERRRLSRSPKRRMSRSPIRRRSRSPIKRRSRSTERRRRSRSTDRKRLSRSPKRRMSRSPKRRMSRSPKRRFSRSPIRRKSRSPVRRISRSPVRRKSKSPIRRRSRSPKREINRSPKRRISKSPIRRKSRSPMRRISKSPVRKISRSPVRRDSRSPVRRISRSPVRRISRSPVRRISRSPVRRISRSPVRRISRSPVKRISKSPVRLSIPPSERKGVSRSRSSELGPKPTPKPAYKPDGASRDTTNLDRGDTTADYNYEIKWKEMERELANTSVNFSFLPPSVTTEDLTDKMGEIGELLEVRAFGMGKALVVFKFRNDAETCIDMYNMAKVDGQTIEVRWASNE